MTEEGRVLFIKGSEIKEDDLLVAISDGWDDPFHLQDAEGIDALTSDRIVLILEDRGPGSLDKIKAFVHRFEEEIQACKVAAIVLENEAESRPSKRESKTIMDPVFHPLREMMLTGRLFYEKRFRYNLPLKQDKRRELVDGIKEMRDCFDTEMKCWPDTTSNFWQRIFKESGDDKSFTQLMERFFSDIKPWYKIIRLFYRTSIRTILKLCFGLKIKGLENVPAKGPFLVAPNHCGHLDSPTVMSSLPKTPAYNTSVLIFEEFRSHLLSRSFADFFLKGIPIDRTDDFIPGLQISSKILRQGYSILFYPEGTRSLTGELQPFKIGIGVLAYELNVPILPVYIKGSYDAMPKGAPFPKLFKKLEIHFGQPITLDRFYRDRGHVKSSRIYKEIIKETRKQIIQLREQAG